MLLGNPRFVQTGLDLHDFPILAFYQTGYSSYSLRQASRSSWRIGQDRDVKVYYWYYRPTLQERAMQLMGSKLEASLAIEGKFSEEGLVAMTQGEDMTTALAKALVDGLEGKGVEQVWSKLNRKSAAYRGKGGFGDGLLFYVDRMVVAKRKSRRGRRTLQKAEQLSLFDGL